MTVKPTRAARPRRRGCRGPGGFVRDRRGDSLLELAFAAPVLMVVLLGAFDMGQYLLLHQKLNRAATAMADLVSQPREITAAEVDELFAAAQRLAVPFDLPANGRVIVSSISRATGEDEARIDWQREGGGSLGASSQIGTVGGTPNLSAGMTLSEGESLIVAEVFYTHEPILLSEFVPTGTIRHQAYRRARHGALDTLN